MSYHLIFNNITFNSIYYMRDFMKNFMKSDYYKIYRYSVLKNIDIIDI